MSVDKYFPDPKAAVLVRAALKGDIPEIQRLKKEGVDINLRGRNDFTPLIFTMLHSLNKEGFKALLDCGADPHLLIDNSPFIADNVVALAAQADDLYWLKELVAHGANMNLVSGYMGGQTPIYFSIRTDRLTNIEYLIKNGADLTYKPELNGFTPLLYASLSCKFDAVYIMLEKGADWRQKDRFGKSMIENIMRYTQNKAVNRKHEMWQWCTKVILWLQAHGAELPAELLDSVKDEKGKVAA